MPRAVVTQGTFDGVHAGHKKILSKLCDRAKQLNGESVVLSFFPHPRMVLFPHDESIKLINSLDENIELLSRAGIEHLIVLEFNQKIANYTALHFVRDILINTIGAKHLIVGYDHRFGHNREGSFTNLTDYASLYDFTLEQINEVDINDITVSSTKIRKAILQGDMETASSYLQHHFSIQGMVTEGNKLGRTIGFPTANIKIIEAYKIIPADGVYAVYVTVDDTRFIGMLNIGNRPTINGITRVIEVNIDNFDANIYHKKIRVELVKRIRDEQKFSTLEDLKKQLLIDRQTVKEILNSKG